jgi:D-tyrosyl-tRNA(Tyr) deacylase
MRALVQRVSRASVDADGGRVAEIGPGLLVLLGITHDDTPQDADRLADKVRALRVFADAEGRMNEPLGDDREVLCVSQFTLYGDARKGNRPAYVAAARPEHAEPLYERFCDRLAAQRGVFGAHMDVELVNDGPVTLLLEVPEAAAPMPPEERIVARFAAEPPQDPLPYGRWADTLQAEFLAACLKVDTEGQELGEAGSMTWFPDRTWAGRTFVPVTSRSTTGLDLFGYVSFTPGDADDEPGDFYSWADFTDETADRHPEWKMDLCEEVIGGWRGENGEVAAITLVWGVPLVRGGAFATAELAGLTVDQCKVAENRYTLIAPDAYRGDYLEIALWDDAGGELARESLYEDDGE